ncbi:hypothetical protein Tco_0147633, partial [Tanacetum coccineum]
MRVKGGVPAQTGQWKTRIIERKMQEVLFAAISHAPVCQREIEEEWYAADKEAYFSDDENDQGRHWKSRPKKHMSNGEDDLSQPWLCEETDPFTARIRYFEVLKRTRMPTN